MARRVRLLPTATTDNEPKLAIAENWARLENAYGHALAENVRQQILEVTTSFAYFEVFERTARPLKEAIDYTSSIRSAANTLQNALAGSFKGSVDTSSYAESLIKQNFHDPRLKVPRNSYGLFGVLSDVLTSLAVACIFALKEMESPDAPGHREGECWESWIKSLTIIASKNGLPWRVSKGSDKSAQDSPFTMLVAALHECVPKDARRHHHSNAALAKAITEARRRSKRDKQTQHLIGKSPA